MKFFKLFFNKEEEWVHTARISRILAVVTLSVTGKHNAKRKCWSHFFQENKEIHQNIVENVKKYRRNYYKSQQFWIFQINISLKMNITPEEGTHLCSEAERPSGESWEYNLYCTYRKHLSCKSFYEENLFLLAFFSLLPFVSA